MNSELKILRAKTRLILEHPFFGTLCSGLKFKEDRASKGMWTDGKTAAYNPFYLETKPFDEVVGLVAHIVLHRALGHHKRVKDRDPSLWNAACDYSINWILLESGFDLPEGYLIRDDLKNKSADDIYHMLVGEKEKKEEEKKGDGSGEEGSNDDSDEAGEAENTILSDSLSDEFQESSIEADGEDDQDEDGSGSSGSEEDSSNDSSPEFTGEVREPESGDEGGPNDSDYDNEKMDMLLSQALNSSLSEGNLPDSLKRMVEDVLRPKLEWSKLLSRFINSTGRSDYTWTTPNKRFLHTGYYLPGVKSENIENVIIAIDTSGSISDAELLSFTSEVANALSVFPGEIVVLGCDTSINFAKTYSAAEIPEKFDLIGGGGTDFRPPFEWAEDNLSNVRCLIYFTDLCSSRYPDDPDYPVLWVTNNEDYMKKPPFGEIININD